MILYIIICIFVLSNQYILEMKIRLFFLAGCLLAAMTLNAQTPEAVAVENKVAVETSASQAAQVVDAYVGYVSYGEFVEVYLLLSEPLNCDAIVAKGQLRIRDNRGGIDTKYFSLRAEPGSTYIYKQYPLSSPGSHTFELRAEEGRPDACDGVDINIGWQE